MYKKNMMKNRIKMLCLGKEDICLPRKGTKDLFKGKRVILF